MINAIFQLCSCLSRFQLKYIVGNVVGQKELTHCHITSKNQRHIDIAFLLYTRRPCIKM